MPAADQGIDVDGLIEILAPLNNAYRASVRNPDVSGATVLEIMWDAGDMLRQAGVCKPDPVAWEIYGKPGQPRRSYITRDFTCSCFRVRRYFPERSNIRGQFAQLQSHNLFKMALPLLDNEKYALMGNERQALCALLNSTGDMTGIKRQIQSMKRTRIAPRKTKATTGPDLTSAARLVAARHKELVEIMNTRNRRRLRSLKKRVGADNLMLLSRMCLALFSEEFQAPNVIGEPEINGLWGRFYLALAPIAEGAPALHNRLKRITGAIVFMELAEMLSAARFGEFSYTVEKSSR